MTEPNQFRIRAIATAIPHVSKENYTTNGVPTTESLEEILGFEVSAAERDAAVKQSKEDSKKVKKTKPADDLSKDFVTIDDVLKKKRTDKEEQE